MPEAAVLADPIVTIAGFDAFLDRQRNPRLWELVAGRILRMTDPTERHQQIVAKVGSPLHQALRALAAGISVASASNAPRTRAAPTSPGPIW